MLRGLQKFLIYIFSSLILFSIISCSKQDLTSERADIASDATDEIVIGVAWPLKSSKGVLWNGLELGMDEINQAGGVLGRKIKLIKKNESINKRIN